MERLSEIERLAEAAIARIVELKRAKPGGPDQPDWLPIGDPSIGYQVLPSGIEDARGEVRQLVRFVGDVLAIG